MYKFVTCLIVIILSIALSNYGTTEAKYIEGSLKSKDEWVFLTRFCFLSERGRLIFKFKFDPLMQPMYLLLYDDTDWPMVYNGNLSSSCQDKVEPLTNLLNSYRIIPLKVDEFFSGCQVSFSGSTNYINCSAERSFLSARERWWFMVLSRCGGQRTDIGVHYPGMEVEYRILMTNSDNDNFFRHFSADDFYILQVDIAFFIAEVLILIVAIMFAAQLNDRELFHVTYKFFLVSLVFDVIHLFVDVIAYGKYANDGLDYSGGVTFGDILGAIAEIIFVLMLLLLAKGYTITRGRISTKGSIMLAVFFTLYAIIYIILFLYQYLAFDPALVLYIYQSPAGYGLVGIRLIAWLWFSYSDLVTVHRYKGEWTFFIPFLIFFTLWFWAGPITIFISNFALDPWVRHTVTNGINCTVTFSGYIFFLIYTRPTAANKNFPYKTRTTQISPTGDMPVTNEPAAMTQFTVEEEHINFTNLFVTSNQSQAKEQKINDEKAVTSPLPDVTRRDNTNDMNKLNNRLMEDRHVFDSDISEPLLNKD